MQDMALRDYIARHEVAGHKIATRETLNLAVKFEKSQLCDVTEESR